MRTIGSIGTPMLDVEVRVVDEAMQDVPQGDVGEIVYRSPMIMTGYWGRPEATAEAFAGGWSHSDDLVRQARRRPGRHPAETRLRLLLHASALPDPVAQFVVRRGRTFLARVDFARPGHRIALEYEGAWHTTRAAADRRRIEALQPAAGGSCSSPRPTCTPLLR